MSKFDPEVKRLAKERGHSYLYIRLDMGTLKPQPGSTVTIQKTLAPGREEELIGLVKRWWAEDAGEPVAPMGPDADLLAALEALLRDVYDGRECSRSCELAECAIAKAKGEQP